MLQTSKSLVLATNNITASSALQIQEQFLSKVVYATRSIATTTCIRVDASALRTVAIFLRNSTIYQFTALMDIVVVDRPSEVNRFSVRYCFLSHRYNQRLIVEVFTNETGTLPSLSMGLLTYNKLFASAG